MKAASIQELKEELTAMSQKRLLELCIRMVKYKKENKELLTYLIFESHDEAGYLENAKKEIDQHFEELPKANFYLTKKSLRKVLRAITKYARHTSSKQAEVEMLIHFCIKLRASGIPINKSVSLMNIYKQQLKKMNTLIQSLHEDLHYDYLKQIEKLAE